MACVILIVMDNDFNPQETPTVNREDNNQLTEENSQSPNSVEVQEGAKLDFDPAAMPQVKIGKWYKSKQFIILVLLLIVGAGVTWYLTKNHKSSQPSTSQATGTVNQQTEVKELKPAIIAYSYKTAEPTQGGGCESSESSSKFELFWRPATGGDRTTAGEIGSKLVSQSDVSREKVVIVTTPECGGSSTTDVLVSKDSGKTYEKIFSTNPSKDGQMEEQITSVKLSNDGSSVVIAVLPGGSSQNTVKEIDISTKQSKDLFTIEQQGVFIEGYNKPKNQIYYYVGCYNCDGNTYNKLYVRDTINDKEDVVYEHDRITEQTVFNKDFTKILLAKWTAGEGLGGGPPYDIEEFDIGSKQSVNLKKINEGTSPRIGYTKEDVPYYTSDTKVSKIAADKSETIVFEAAKPILNVYLVSADQVIASSGEYNDNVLTNYTLSDKKTIEILKGDTNTNIFGVTWN